MALKILVTSVALRGKRGSPENGLKPPQDIYKAYLKSTTKYNIFGNVSKDTHISSDIKKTILKCTLRVFLYFYNITYNSQGFHELNMQCTKEGVPAMLHIFPSAMFSREECWKMSSVTS